MHSILRMRDRIKLTVNGIEFVLKPLTVMEQAEIATHKKIEAGETVEDLLMQSFAYIKFSLKDIKGIKDSTGEEYKLEFDGDYLSDDCVSEIFTLNLGEEMFHAIQRLKHNHIPERMTYFGTNKELEGVSLEVLKPEGVDK